MAAAGVDRPRSTLASLGSGQWQLLFNLHRYYAAGETPQRALQHPIPFPVPPFLLTSLFNPNSAKMLEKEVGHFGDGFV